MSIEALPLDMLVFDKNAPVPGDDGIITSNLAIQNTIQIQWSPASDRETAQDELQYRLYRSSDNNISTIEDAEQNGLVVHDWQAGMLTGTATGLDPGTTYYFNVVVRDGSGLMAAYQSASFTTRNGPIPGNSGMIMSILVTQTSIQIQWSRANDVETHQADLQYQLYQSAGNNISTPSDADMNGTIIKSWTPDMTANVVIGLDPATTYYFNVVVRDGDGLTAAYQTVAIATLTDKVYLFPAGMHNGQLAAPAGSSLSVVTARNDIDDMCMQAWVNNFPSIPCSSVHGFISVNATDDIAGMPDNFGAPTDRKIIGPTGTTVAENWADLLDGSIESSLSDANVTSEHWWSGSLADGTYSSSVDNCVGWTYTGKKGQCGKSERLDPFWIEGETPDCNATRMVLCSCW